MRKLFACIALAAIVVGGTHIATAADFGTAAEAEAMLTRAIVVLKADPAAAIEKFNKGEDGFRDRDLYVFCLSASDARTTAHANPRFIGVDARTFKDPTGHAFGEEFFNTAQEGKILQASYLWPRPGSDAPVPKESHFTRVGGQICGVGYYK